MTSTEVIEEETEIEETIEMEGKLLYDPAGNLVGNMLNNKRQYVYSYDYKNRLVQIEKNIYKKDQLETTIKVVQITYDVLGRRIQKKFNNGAYRNYVYSNQDIVLEQNYSKKDKLKNSKQFIYGNQVDDVLSMIDTQYKTRKVQEEFVNKKGKTKTRTVKEAYTETSNYSYQKDHLGSIIAITDESANIVEEYVYDVFGKPYSKHADGSVTGLKKSPIGNTRLYTGREYDRGLQLYYNRARYYNPQLGRFISRDPIDIADDVNLYGYVGNNSVMFVDRMGLASKAFLESSDATAKFLEYIEKGKKFHYNYRYQKDFTINSIGFNAPTVSDTLASYLNASQPGGEFDVKRSIDFKVLGNTRSNQEVFINGEIYETNELGNFFIGLNGQRAGLSLNEINNYGLIVEGYQSATNQVPFNVQDELYDQHFYKIGYTYGIIENEGKLSQSELGFYSFYLLSNAKNEK